MTEIDINCDMGESFGAVADGGGRGGHAAHHVGQHRVRRARRRSVGDAADRAPGPRGRRRASARIPGFADLQGFGRREMQVDPAELEDS